MISLNNEPCCICGETRSVLLQEAEYPEHAYPGSFCLRQCECCGLLFNSPRLEGEELTQLYGKSYYFFNRPDAPEIARIVPMYARSIAMLDEDETREKVALDVGSGRGFFPAILKRLGWDAHGVEISREASDYARKRFGLDTIFTGTIEQYADSPTARQFPIVTAIDVIEHVPSPASFIAAIAKTVRAGGVLIVDTPNAAAYNIRVQGKSWKGFNPFHIFLFTIQNLRQLLAQNGLTVEQSFSYGNIPVDRSAPLLKARLRNASIAAARSLRLIRPAALAYFKVQSMRRTSGDIEQHLDEAVAKIKSGSSYLNSPDAEESLAREAIGDNIVLIARKNNQ